MSRFQFTDDYILNAVAGITTSGTGSGTTGWLDLGQYADIVDFIATVVLIDPANEINITGYQNSTSEATGSATLSLDDAIATITATGQYKQRLVAGEDAGDWDGPVNGRYVCFEAVVTGTGTTTSYVLGNTLTLQSRNYPVE